MAVDHEAGSKAALLEQVLAARDAGAPFAELDNLITELETVPPEGQVLKTLFAKTEAG
jgi:hypothetical protein